MRDGRLRSQLLSAVAAMLANVDSDVSAVGSMVWGDSKGQPLIGPIRRHIHQTRDAASRLALAAMFDWLDEAFR